MNDEEAAGVLAKICSDLHIGLGLDEDDRKAIVLIGTAISKAYRLGQSSAKEEMENEQRISNRSVH